MLLPQVRGMAAERFIRTPKENLLQTFETIEVCYWSNARSVATMRSASASAGKRVTRPPSGPTT